MSFSPKMPLQVARADWIVHAEPLYRYLHQSSILQLGNFLSGLFLPSLRKHAGSAVVLIICLFVSLTCLLHWLCLKFGVSQGFAGRSISRFFFLYRLMLLENDYMSTKQICGGRRTSKSPPGIFYTYVWSIHCLHGRDNASPWLDDSPHRGRPTFH